MFKSYMDEAGIQFNDAYCTIGGYVGDVLEWEKVEHDWKFVLAEFKTPYFHALEFYGSDAKYKNWPDSKRAAFINLLFDCLRDHEIWLLSSSIDVGLFRSLTEDERHYITGGQHNGMRWTRPGAPSKPYFVPFHNAIIQAAQRAPVNEVVYPVMSRQDQYKMKALELYDLVLNSSPALVCRPKLADDMVFSDPKKVAQLQAADLAAYWIGQAMKHRAKTGSASLAGFSHSVELKRLFERLYDWSDMKLFDFQGLMLVLGGTNRYLRTSFVTRDQILPSLPVQRRKEVLSAMRMVNFRKFLDQWQPSAPITPD